MISPKRLSALMLMLALVVPMLAACGSSSGQAAPTAAPGAGAAATAVPTTSTAPTFMAEQPTTAAGGAATAAPATGGQAQVATAGASGDLTKIQVEDGATLRVSSWGDPSEQKVNTDSFARFNKIFPNVKIQYEPQPADFQTKMKADFAGNTEPDVFYIDSSL